MLTPAQLSMLKQMAKPKDRGLVGQTAHAVAQAGELSVQGHIVQRLFHGRIAQTEPLLGGMNAEHRLDCEGRAADLGPRAVRLDDLHQCAPGHRPVHLVEELALPRLLRGQIQTQTELTPRRHAFGYYGFRSC